MPAVHTTNLKLTKPGSPPVRLCERHLRETQEKTDTIFSQILQDPFVKAQCYTTTNGQFKQGVIPEYHHFSWSLYDHSDGDIQINATNRLNPQQTFQITIPALPPDNSSSSSSSSSHASARSDSANASRLCHHLFQIVMDASRNCPRCANLNPDRYSYDRHDTHTYHTYGSNRSSRRNSSASLVDRPEERSHHHTGGHQQAFPSHSDRSHSDTTNGPRSSSPGNSSGSRRLSSTPSPRESFEQERTRLHQERTEHEERFFTERRRIQEEGLQLEAEKARFANGQAEKEANLQAAEIIQTAKFETEQVKRKAEFEAEQTKQKAQLDADRMLLEAERTQLAATRALLEAEQAAFKREQARLTSEAQLTAARITEAATQEAARINLTAKLRLDEIELERARSLQQVELAKQTNDLEAAQQKLHLEQEHLEQQKELEQEKATFKDHYYTQLKQQREVLVAADQKNRELQDQVTSLEREKINLVVELSALMNRRPQGTEAHQGDPFHLNQALQTHRGARDLLARTSDILEERFNNSRSNNHSNPTSHQEARHAPHIPRPTSYNATDYQTNHASENFSDDNASNRTDSHHTNNPYSSTTATLEFDSNPAVTATLEFDSSSAISPMHSAATSTASNNTTPRSEQNDLAAWLDEDRLPPSAHNNSTVTRENALGFDKNEDNSLPQRELSTNTHVQSHDSLAGDEWYNQSTPYDDELADHNANSSSSYNSAFHHTIPSTTRISQNEDFAFIYPSDDDDNNDSLPAHLLSSQSSHHPFHTNTRQKATQNDQSSHIPIRRASATLPHLQSQPATQPQSKQAKARKSKLTKRRASTPITASNNNRSATKQRKAEILKERIEMERKLRNTPSSSDLYHICSRKYDSLHAELLELVNQERLEDQQRLAAKLQPRKLAPSTRPTKPKQLV